MNPTAAILLDSPFGTLYLAASETALTDLRFAATDDARPVAPTDAPGGPAGAILKRAAAQLADYVAGRLHDFDLPVDPPGTPFQRSVWEALRTIPFGATLSYGELARRIERPRAVRAVGAANGRNPISIVLPCHRVIGADGSLTGYGGGLPVKEALLELERG